MRCTNFWNLFQE